MTTRGVLALFILLVAIISSLANPPQDPAKPKDEGVVSRGDRLASPEPDEVIEVNTNLVNVPVTVFDRDGRFVSDLRQEEFKVFEEGIEQEISFFAPVESSFSVILLIDTSPSTRDRRKEIRAAALSFVDQLRADDNVMVLTFSGDLWVVSPRTRDRSALRKAISELKWEGNGTVLYGAVDAVMNHIFRRLRGRKALIILTDGEDNDARLKIAELASTAPKNEIWTMSGPPCSELPCATFEDNFRDAEELDALIYPIKFGVRTDNQSLLEDSAAGAELDKRSDATLPRHQRANLYLRGLAMRTGGRLYSAEKGQDLTAVFNSIANELRHQYSLGYYVKTKANPGERRQIKVKVTRPNLAVRAKPGYLGARKRTRIRSTPPPAP